MHNMFDEACTLYRVPRLVRPNKYHSKIIISTPIFTKLQQIGQRFVLLVPAKCLVRKTTHVIGREDHLHNGL